MKLVTVRQDGTSPFVDDTTMNIQSERVRKALTLKNKQFKRLFGVKKETFERMLEIMQQAFEELHKLGGKPLTKLKVEDKLLLAMQSWREYRTMEHLADEYGVVNSAVHGAIVWVENSLIRDGTFRLPGKKALIAGENKPKTILIDVTENPIERPKKSNNNTLPAHFLTGTPCYQRSVT